MLRKMRDSNPRYPEEGIPDFESSAFGHSANLPFYFIRCKSNTFFPHTKLFLLFFALCKVFYLKYALFLGENFYLCRLFITFA